MKTIDIYRSGELFVTVKPDDTSTQLKKIMGENQVTLTFRMSSYADFSINDYCTIYGEKYQLNKLPVVKKISQYLYQYTLVMEVEGNDLSKYQFLFLGADNTLRESEFSLMGNPDTFMDLLIANANRVGSGWIKGEVISTTVYKNLTFSGDNCYNALGKMAEAFDTEFWLVGKTVNLSRKQKDTGYIFRHGRYKGLYDITRQNLDNSGLVTRLYAYGSDKNLPPDYNNFAKRLQMRDTTAVIDNQPNLIHDITWTVVDNGDGTQTITFSFTDTINEVTDISPEWRLTGSSADWKSVIAGNSSPIEVTLPTGTYNFRFRSYITGDPNTYVTPEVTVSGSEITPQFPSVNYPVLPYIEKNTELYGVIEAIQNFENIFPHRTGKVTSVNALNFYKFIDSTIDFNLNNYLLSGLTAKVVFNTGQLAGYQFEISNFNFSTKEITILKNQDETALDIPSQSLKPAIGDEYVFVDIRMPKSYIDAAETDLKEAAQALLDDISIPQVTYQLTFDPVYMKRKGISIGIGDLVWVQDDQLRVERRIRVNQVTRSIVDEYQYQVELSDTVTVGTIDRIINSQQATNTGVSNLNDQFSSNTVLNKRIIGNLSIEQGTIQAPDMPEAPDTTGMKQLYIDGDGKVWKG